MIRSVWLLNTHTVPEGICHNAFICD